MDKLHILGKLFRTFSAFVCNSGNFFGFWRCLINKHGTKDVPAMIQKIHDIKSSELNLSNPDIDDDQPYNLRVMTHSLGGVALLMYVVTRHIEDKAHRLLRLVLLSPAGFLSISGIVFTLVERTLTLLALILARVGSGEMLEDKEVGYDMGWSWRPSEGRDQLSEDQGPGSTCQEEIRTKLLDDQIKDDDKEAKTE